MASEVRVTRFEPDDESQAIRLLVEKLPPAEREGAHEKRLVRWRWQYNHNPNNPDGKPLIWVARVTGGLGGMVATVPVRLRTPKGLVLGMWGVDFIVDSSMRGRGIGRKLLTAWNTHPGVSFVLGWTPASFRVASGVGFKAVWGFTTSTIALSRLRFGMQLMKTSRGRALLRLTRVWLRGNPRTRHGFLPVAVTRDIPAGADELWGQVAKGYRFSVERDVRYLRWRFVSHPTHKYHFVLAGDPGNPAGLAVCRLTGDDPPLGIISDLIVHPTRHDVLVTLLDETVGFLKSGGACALSADLPPALAPQVLRRYRCALERPMGIIVRTQDADFEKAGIFTPDQWYISRSDADQDY
jgi:GNAT superfamily N-acetyltransferase